MSDTSRAPHDGARVRRPRTRIAPDPDRIMPPQAAELTGLSYPEAFNAARWELEEGVDPATGAAIPIPTEIRVPYLTTSQVRKLEPEERTKYLAKRAKRIAWTKAHWMRVRCWGGRAAPGGEYRYSAALCIEWSARMAGQPIDEDPEAP